MGAWGSSSWGSGTWGLGAEVDLYIVNAFAVATKIVRVTLSREPERREGWAGSVNDPNVWDVVRQDTGASLRVISVFEADPPLTFDLLLFVEHGSVNITHEVSSDTLRTPAGDLITGVHAYEFPGTLSQDTATKAARQAARGGTRDLANLVVSRGDVDSGTLVVNAAGDYELESGVPLVRKLLLRRFTARKGEFFHLPDYGEGLAEKDLLPTGDLVKLKRRLEIGAQKESELQQVRVSLDLLAENVLLVKVVGKMRRTNEPFSFSFRAANGTVTF